MWNSNLHFLFAYLSFGRYHLLVQNGASVAPQNELMAIIDF